MARASSLTKQQLKQFHQALMQERTKFAGEIRAITREASKSPRGASGGRSADTAHMADLSADTYERELSMDIASSEQKVLYEIDDALKRLEEGTYGACQQCAKPVSLSRLRAVPYTSMCISCQRAKEQQTKG